MNRMTPTPLFVLAWVTQNGDPVTPMGQGGSVLFVEHPQRGWEIPGGHLEPGETPEEALARELRAKKPDSMEICSSGTRRITPKGGLRMWW